MKQFYGTFMCGKMKRIVDLGDEGTRISGIRVRQLKDASFKWDMDEYVRDHMKSIDVPRGFISKTCLLYTSHAADE